MCPVRAASRPTRLVAVAVAVARELRIGSRAPRSLVTRAPARAVLFLTGLAFLFCCVAVAPVSWASGSLGLAETGNGNTETYRITLFQICLDSSHIGDDCKLCAWSRRPAGAVRRTCGAASASAQTGRRRA
jgi:hypothetical protein